MIGFIYLFIVLVKSSLKYVPIIFNAVILFYENPEMGVDKRKIKRRSSASITVANPSFVLFLKGLSINDFPL